MEALSLIPSSLDNIGEEEKPRAWRERLFEVIRRVNEFFQDVVNTPIDGTLRPIVISLLTLAAFMLGALLFGWTHASCGP